MATVDAALAERVTRWGALSVKKTEQAIDALVEEIDAGALRRSRAGNLGRDVEFGSPSDEPGFTSMWARLYAPDAVAVRAPRRGDGAQRLRRRSAQYRRAPRRRADRRRRPHRNGL